jgi:hypothetical protein
MRLLLALVLLSAPVLAKSAKPAKNGEFCPKAALGKTTKDKKGATLTCTAQASGAPRWKK